MAIERHLKVAKRSLSKFYADEAGGTLMEYGLVAALIAFAIVGIITSMGETLNAAFTSINSDLESTISGM
jgi:pilus assembly protein Flp/PilA